MKLHHHKLLMGVPRVSIKKEGSREINYGNCITASRPDRISPGTHWIGRSNAKNGVYPTTQLLLCVARVSIINEKLEKLIMEFVSQLHAPTALFPELIGDEARMIILERTLPQNYKTALLGFL
jgi:hypothetical protein